MTIPKILYVIIIIIIILCCFSSCIRKVTVQCKPAYNIYMFFYSPSANDTLTDTLVSFIPYQRGSNFTIESNGAYESSMQMAYFGRGAVMKQNVSEYDWKIITHPSEKQYLLKDFMFHPRTEKKSPNDLPSECYDDYSYNLDDSVVNKSSGYIFEATVDVHH